MKKVTLLSALVSFFLFISAAAFAARVTDDPVLYKNMLLIPFKIIKISPGPGPKTVQMQTEDGRWGIIAAVDSVAGLQAGDLVRIENDMKLTKITKKAGPASTEDQVRADLGKIIKAIQEKNIEKIKSYCARGEAEELLSSAGLLFMALGQSYPEQFTIKVKGNKAIVTDKGMEFNMVKEDGMWKMAMDPAWRETASKEPSRPLTPDAAPPAPAATAAPAPALAEPHMSSAPPAKKAATSSVYNITRSPYNARYYQGKIFTITSMIGYGDKWMLGLEMGDAVLSVEVDNSANLDTGDKVRIAGKTLVKMPPVKKTSKAASARRTAYAERIAVYDKDTLSSVGEPLTVTEVDPENGRVSLEPDDEKGPTSVQVVDVARLKRCDRVTIWEDMRLARLSGEEGEVVKPPRGAKPAAKVRGWGPSLECYAGKVLTVTETGLKPAMPIQGQKTVGIKLKAEGVGKTWKIDVSDDSRLRVGNRVVLDNFDRELFVLSPRQETKSQKNR